MKILITSILSVSITFGTISGAFADKSLFQDDIAIATGIFGLATGVIIGNAISKPNNSSVQRIKPAHPSRIYYDNHRNHENLGSPYSPEWYRYCAKQHRSFEAKSGTYRDHRGRTQFCTIPTNRRPRHR